MNKKLAVLMVLVIAFSPVNFAFADYRTGSAAGDGAAYGAVGAVAGGGAMVAVAWWFSGTLTVICPPVGIAAAVGACYLGWYGATDPDKDIVKDVEKTVQAGVWGVTAGTASAVEKAGEETVKVLIK